MLKKEGGIGAIHAEDDEIVMHMYDVLQREGRTGFENLAEVHNTMSEDLSFRRIIRLAEHVDGTPLYMMHVSAATGVAAIEAARAKGFNIMVGCMLGTSLAMAPAFLIAALADFVDLDGPLLLSKDRELPLVYSNSIVMPPNSELWG